MKFTGLFFFLFLSFNISLFSQKIDFDSLMTAALYGDIDAQYGLGYHYYVGDIVEHNLDSAVYWYRLAADQGYMLAQHNLATVYLIEDKYKNEQKALDLFMRAADQGDEKSQYQLGMFYGTGEIVPKNVGVAYYYLTLAAENGDQLAQYQLSKFDESGNLKPGEEVEHPTLEDLDEYAKEYEKGKREKSNNNSKPSVAKNNRKRPQTLEEAVEKLPDTMTQEHFAENYQDYLDMLELSMEEGDMEAAYLLGLIYIEIRNEARDEELGLSLIKYAAENDHAQAQNELGTMYFEGRIVEKDLDLAIEWFRKAAANGYAFSMTTLGVFYHNGEYLPQDYAKAFQWYMKAAQLGDVEAQYFLGFMYKDGVYVNQDDDEALRWFVESAELNYNESQMLLAALYVIGDLVEVNMEKAAYWCRRAYNNGHELAQEFWYEYRLWKYDKEGEFIPRY